LIPASPTGRITTLALLAAVGTSLFVLESFIPNPFPFIRLGIANVSALVALYLFSAREMMLVVLVRVVVGALLTGTFFSPSFILSFAGGLASAAVMVSVRAAAPGIFGPIGISLFGSVTHVLTQLAVVVLLFIENDSMLMLLPLLLSSAIVSGVLVGWLAAKMYDAIVTFQPGAGWS
jgi:heptaprenyl diphosphate synthase